MFDMHQVGRKIALRRKERNMTQMALADAMGVSFQAVSNWERGHSMPDIGKLPELSAVLNLTIDELLTDGESIRLIQHILDGDSDTYIRERGVTTNTVAQVAPLLKPQQAEDMLENVLSRDAEEDLLEDLAQAAPYVSESFLHEQAMKLGTVENVHEIVSIAPFLADRTLDLLVEKLSGESLNIRAILPLAPFLSERTVNDLAQRCVGDMDLSSLHKLAPFLSHRTLDEIVHGLAEDSEVTTGQLVALAPFVSQETLGYLAEKLSGDTLRIDALLPLAPFLPEETIDGLAREAAGSANVSDLASIAPFVSDRVLDELALAMVDAGDVSLGEVGKIAPFLSTEVLDLLCEQAMETADPKQIAGLAPFLSTKTLQACAERLIARHGLKGIRDIAHFL